MRRVDEVVATLEVLVLPKLFDLVAHEATLRMPQNQTGTELTHGREQIEVDAETTVIALGRFFEVLAMRRHRFLVGERVAVDARQHLVVGVVAEVGAGKCKHGNAVTDLGSRRHVRALAEVDEVARVIERQALVFRDLGNGRELVVLVVLFHQLDRSRAIQLT